MKQIDKTQLNLQYKEGTEVINWEQLYTLYKEVGLVAGLASKGDFEGIKKAFISSYKVVTAWDGDNLVGAARLISDGICYGCIFDVGVLPTYQRLGIGKGMILNLLEGNRHMGLSLTSAFGKEEFYKKLGFKKQKNTFAMYPVKSEYLED